MSIQSAGVNRLLVEVCAVGKWRNVIEPLIVTWELPSQLSVKTLVGSMTSAKSRNFAHE